MLVRPVLQSVVFTSAAHIMPDVSIVSANLATVCMESLLYGSFFVLFWLSTFLLGRRVQHIPDHQASMPAGSKNAFKSPMFVASVCIFCTVTAVRFLFV